MSQHWTLLLPLRRPGLVLALATLAALSSANQAAPGALADPTRPPPGMAIEAAPPTGLGTASPSGQRLPRAVQAEGANRTAANPSAAVAQQATAQPLPVLQAVQVNARGPASAMLDGRLVRTGDTVGTRRVISIDVEGVVLRGGGVTERLWLLQGAPKQPVGSIVVHRAARYTADAASTPHASPAGNAVLVPASPASPASPVPPTLPTPPADAAGTTPPSAVMTVGQRTSQ